ncbi:hypothetical protein [Streptomyces collinus]|uniref:hypothetical protein n=1 Tax=Streptomyces collinus TaxID=42684 RepID=UPI00332B2A6F
MRTSGLDAGGRGSALTLHRELEELTARHALLMHASVLADAEAAAEPAKHAAVVVAAQARAA